MLNRTSICQKFKFSLRKFKQCGPCQRSLAQWHQPQTTIPLFARVSPKKLWMPPWNSKKRWHPVGIKGLWIWGVKIPRTVISHQRQGKKLWFHSLSGMILHIYLPMNWLSWSKKYNPASSLKVKPSIVKMHNRRIQVSSRHNNNYSSCSISSLKVNLTSLKQFLEVLTYFQVKAKSK